MFLLSNFLFILYKMRRSNIKYLEELPTCMVTTILVVDDNESNLLLAKLILKNYFENRSEELKYYEAKNGKEGIKAAKKLHQQLDLILMDINMPGMSGIQATQKIKEQYTHIPIIAYTAFAETYLNDKEQSPFDGILTKPVSQGALEKTINKYIQSNKEK